MSSNDPFKWFSVSLPYNVPREKRVYINLFDKNGGKIGKEEELRVDEQYYEKKVEEILHSRVYNDLLQEDIKIVVETLDNKILYIFERKPIEKRFL